MTLVKTLPFIVAASAAAIAQDRAPVPFVPRNTHGVDMRTQAGPAGPVKYSPPFPVDPTLPTLWLIGDSTVRNGTAGDGTNLNQWGWGAPLTFDFDPHRINVVNRALGGTSARSFYRNNWKKMAILLKPHDFLLLQFGTNDGSALTKVGDLPGLGAETKQMINRAGEPETVHTYGWYMAQLIEEAKARGVTVVVCSLIPRKAWDSNGHIRRNRDTYAGWAAAVAASEGVGFVDLNELSAQRLDALGKREDDRLYVPNPTPEHPEGEHVHPGWDGAVLNAEAVVSGLRALPGDPFSSYLSTTGRAIRPASR